jgi:uncharacterized protein
MKFLLVLPLLFLIPAGLAAQSVPAYDGYVTDRLQLIPQEARQTIESIARQVEERTGAQIAVLTIESYGEFGFGSIRELGIAVADQWQVGAAGDDTGVIIILAMEERTVGIEVGFGLEGALPDGRVGAIIDQAIIPSFQAGRYGDGFTEAVRMVAGVIGEEFGQDLSDLGTRPVPASRSGGAAADELGRVFTFLVIFLLFGGNIFIFPFLRRSRRGFYGGGFGAHHRGYYRSTSFRGRGFGGGGFGGGGFGGFGGGGFGGGGASRRF